MVLEIRDIALGYKGSETLCAGVSQIAKQGESVALIGRNGVGKSTLLRSVVGIAAPRSGSVLLDRRLIGAIHPSHRARMVSYVSTEMVAPAYMTVENVVALGRMPYSGWAGSMNQADRQVVRQAMERVDVMQFATRTLDTLSDGQRQRVMIARALAQDTPCMVLDEPTSFLDWENREVVIRMLADMARDMDKIVLFSTHERDLASRYASHVWMLTPDGIVVQ